MEIEFSVIVAIIVIAIVYFFVLSFRKSRFGRKLAGSSAAPGPKEHGVDLQARRKLHDDVT